MLYLCDCNAKIWWTYKTIRGHGPKSNLPFSRVLDVPTSSSERGAMGGWSYVNLCLSLEPVLLQHWAPALWALERYLQCAGDVGQHPAGGGCLLGWGCGTKALAGFTLLCWPSSAAWILGCKKRRWNLTWPFLRICRYGAHKHRELGFSKILASWKLTVLVTLYWWLFCLSNVWV